MIPEYLHQFYRLYIANTKRGQCQHCGSRAVDHNLECMVCDEPIYIEPNEEEN